MDFREAVRRHHEHLKDPTKESGNESAENFINILQRAEDRTHHASSLSWLNDLFQDGHLSQDQQDRIINLKHIPKTNQSSQLVDGIMENMPDEKRKQILNDKLGITGGKKIRDVEKDHDWNNWESPPTGDESDPYARFYKGIDWESSKHLTDDQAEHIKRHGSVEQKLNLFSNPHIDPRHGIEMWNKWSDNDTHHGYHRHHLSDYLMRHQEDNIEDDIEDRAYTIAQNRLPIDKWAKETLAKNGLKYFRHKDELLNHINDNLDLYDTVGPNPGFNKDAPVDPANNPETIDYADPNNPQSKTINDHPNLPQLLQQADNQLINTKGYPSVIGQRSEGIPKLHEGEWHHDAVREMSKNIAEDLREEAISSAYKNEDYLPKHLRGKISSIKNELTSKSQIDTKNAFANNGLDISKFSSDHEYAPGLYHLNMLKDHTENNKGKIDLGSMVKKYPDMKDALKSAFGDKQSLSSKDIDSKIKSLPKTKYSISARSWEPQNPQNLNRRNQLVLRLEHTPESMAQIKSDPSLENIFNKVHKSSKASDHPVGTNTIGWARIDTSDPSHWVIDETQSDFSESLIRTISENEYNPSKRQSIVDGIQKIRDIHGNWQENLMSHIVDLAKKHGVEKLSIHTPESKASQLGASRIHSAYRENYQKTPKSMGFSKTEGLSLPLTDLGRIAFTKKIPYDDKVRQDTHYFAMGHHRQRYHVHKAIADRIRSESPEIAAEHDETAKKHKMLFFSHRRKGLRVKAPIFIDNPPNDLNDRRRSVSFHEPPLNMEGLLASKKDLKEEPSGFVGYHSDSIVDGSMKPESLPAHTLEIGQKMKKSVRLGKILARKIMEAL
jgi:hypothetical protein